MLQGKAMFAEAFGNRVPKKGIEGFGEHQNDAVIEGPLGKFDCGKSFLYHRVAHEMGSVGRQYTLVAFVRGQNTIV